MASVGASAAACPARPPCGGEGEAAPLRGWPLCCTCTSSTLSSGLLISSCRHEREHTLLLAQAPCRGASCRGCGGPGAAASQVRAPGTSPSASHLAGIVHHPLCIPMVHSKHYPTSVREQRRRALCWRPRCAGGGIPGACRRGSAGDRAGTVRRLLGGGMRAGCWACSICGDVEAPPWPEVPTLLAPHSHGASKGWLMPVAGAWGLPGSGGSCLVISCSGSEAPAAAARAADLPRAAASLGAPVPLVGLRQWVLQGPSHLWQDPWVTRLLRLMGCRLGGQGARRTQAGTGRRSPPEDPFCRALPRACSQEKRSRPRVARGPL